MMGENCLCRRRCVFGVSGGLEKADFWRGTSAESWRIQKGVLGCRNERCEDYLSRVGLSRDWWRSRCAYGEKERCVAERSEGHRRGNHDSHSLLLLWLDYQGGKTYYVYGVR